MSKTVEFENALGDLITEIFTTKTELQEAIRYFQGVTIAGVLEDNLQYME
jgi:hypothetical protein